MEAPSSICRALAEFHPKLRLGWDGEAKAFGLIQIFHRHDFAQSFREEWGHGPVFSRKGRPSPDWDLLSHVPVYLIKLDTKSVGFDPHIQGWGKLLKLVKRWARPIAARVYNKAKAKGRYVENFVDAMGRDMGDKVFYRSNHGDMGAGSPIVARKHIDKRAEHARRVGGKTFEESQLPPAPKGGWDKALAADRIGENDPDDLGSVRSAV